jgi:hypothetical protein
METIERLGLDAADLLTAETSSEATGSDND